MSSYLATPQLTPECLALIKHFEGCRLDAYHDAVGAPTIGYGHTGGVRRGVSITPKEADGLLRMDLNGAVGRPALRQGPAERQRICRAGLSGLQYRRYGIGPVALHQTAQSRRPLWRGQRVRALLDYLYDGRDEPEPKIIDVFIRKLRRKLALALNGEQYIKTVWGRGFELREPSRLAAAA